ncbi:hypothetical protein EYZ11_009035 [Aspergillus tanneri]|uniref:Uncharacterized protein n=1 Tax=Aspergillus tanneri TaxID=1220188 RepID=A0A4V3UNK2_9EURO|nr:hypothetical protein EYZ11_009035 [Aspergillus tanneri]
MLVTCIRFAIFYTWLQYFTVDNGIGSVGTADLSLFSLLPRHDVGRVDLGDAVEYGGFELRDPPGRRATQLYRDILRNGRKEEGLVSVIEGQDGRVERVSNDFTLGKSAVKLRRQCEGY